MVKMLLLNVIISISTPTESLEFMQTMSPDACLNQQEYLQERLEADLTSWDDIPRKVTITCQ